MSRKRLAFAWAGRVAFGTAACFVGACSPSLPAVEQDGEAQTTVAEARFTPREVEAARKLSLAGDQSLTEAASEYERALRCHRALARLSQTLRRTGLATGEQLSLLQQARERFERRTRQNGLQEGRSAATIQRELEQRPSATTDVSNETRAGLACIRALQGEA